MWPTLILGRRTVLPPEDAQGHHLVTQAQRPWLFPPSRPRGKVADAAPSTGHKSTTSPWVRLVVEKLFTSVQPVYGESGLSLRYYTFDRSGASWAAWSGCLGDSSTPWPAGFDLHRFDFAAAGDHPPLRLALQDRGQFQAGHSHRRRPCLSLLDAGHEPDPARRRFATPASPVRKTTVKAVRRKLGGLRTHIQLGLIAQRLLQYLAVTFRRASGLISIPISARLAPKNAFGMVVLPTPCRHRWPQFLAGSPDSAILRNSSPLKSASTGCGYVVYSDWKMRHECTYSPELDFRA